MSNGGVMDFTSKEQRIIYETKNFADSMENPET